MVFIKLILAFQEEGGSESETLTFSPSGNNIVWPNEQVKKEAIEKGIYKPCAIIPTRFQFFDNSVFFTFPKLRHGVPFSLGQMSIRDKSKCNPNIYPYPSWEDHNVENCDAIRNAVDLYLDENDTLWVLDVGVINTLEEPENIAAPKVIGINPVTSKIKYSINLSNLILNNSRLQFLVVEILDTNPIIYISDAGTRSILVFDVNLSKGHRVILPATINKDSKIRNVLYLLLIRNSCEGNTLLFTYLGSSILYGVKTCLFRKGETHGSIIRIGSKPGKMVFLGTDNGLNIFFRFQGDNEIFLWNSATTFSDSNFILVQRPNSCRMATHITAGYKRMMWVLESNFQDYISGNVGCLGVIGNIHPLVKNCDSALDNEMVDIFYDNSNTYNS
ncbi:major royal jelly protein 1-like [Lycorma delicatula]|uniref:major royal jelly protein 1-like n=1 Tax=Lycorma delicatula TaxID=130591 RepID=UPI003F50E9DE